MFPEIESVILLMAFQFWARGTTHTEGETSLGYTLAVDKVLSYGIRSRNKLVKQWTSAIDKKKLTTIQQV